MLYDYFVDILSPLSPSSSNVDSSDASATSVAETSKFNFVSFTNIQDTEDILSPIDSNFLSENLRDTPDENLKFQVRLFFNWTLTVFKSFKRRKSLTIWNI